MTISSCIVFIFTSLLFLSGYVLQQQTVRSLQAALHPPPPPSASSTGLAIALTRTFGHSSDSKSHGSYEAYFGKNTSTINWKKAAYVQLVRKHMEVCNAAMVFGELARQESRAQRVLLYPREWDRQEGRIEGAHDLDTSMRLLRVVSNRYNVILSPVDPILEVSEVPIEIAYPLSGLLSLISFDKILYLQPSGLILDSSLLDALFTIHTNSSLTAFSDPLEYLSPVILVQPSDVAFGNALAAIQASPLSEETHLEQNTHFFHLPPSLPTIASLTSSLHLAGEKFDSDNFIAQTGYMQLLDPNIPGPEYDVPRTLFLQSRPDGNEARKAWEDLYEIYRLRRMDICGLDLEPMPIVDESDAVKHEPVSPGEITNAKELPKDSTSESTDSDIEL